MRGPVGPVRPTDRPGGHRPGWLPLAVAALVVPTALAGLTLLWPGPQIEDGLARAANESLTAAGITGATASLSGRDATVAGVPGPDAPRAVRIVQDVTGVRVARALPAEPAPAEPAPAEPAPTAPSDGGEVPSTAELDAALDALLGATPITFEPNSPALTPQGSATVARVLELVSAAPNAGLRVDGFVAAGPGDGRFTAQELSAARAATVRDALVAGGVPADRVVVRGLGEGQDPVPDAAGRRVDITVV